MILNLIIFIFVFGIDGSATLRYTYDIYLHIWNGHHQRTEYWVLSHKPLYRMYFSIMESPFHVQCGYLGHTDNEVKFPWKTDVSFYGMVDMRNEIRAKKRYGYLGQFLRIHNSFKYLILLSDNGSSIKLESMLWCRNRKETNLEFIRTKIENGTDNETLKCECTINEIISKTFRNENMFFFFISFVHWLVWFWVWARTHMNMYSYTRTQSTSTGMPIWMNYQNRIIYIMPGIP